MDKLILIGIFIFGLGLFFWPAVKNGTFTIILIIGACLSIYLFFVRAWVPFLISVISIYVGLGAIGGAIAGETWGELLYRSFSPVLWLTILGLTGWLFTRIATSLVSKIKTF